MNLLVLIKCSLDVAEIKVDGASGRLILEGVPLRLGDVDKNVVEAAVRLKEKVGGKITAVSVGPKAAQDLFRDALAMGVDEVFLIEEPPNIPPDPRVLVRILEAAIQKLAPVDLILCGFASDDGYSFQVGPRLGERTGFPVISYARELEIEGIAVTALQDLEERQRRVKASLPAVVSIAEEAFKPRRITLMDALKAKKKPVTIWQAEGDLGLKESSYRLALGVKVQETRGVVTRRKQQMIQGDNPAEAADRLIDLLVGEGVLAERRRSDG